MKKWIFLLTGAFSGLFALTAQVVNTGQLVMSGETMVIRNLDFHNKSGATFNHKDGKVIFYGTNWDNDGTLTAQPTTSNAQTFFKGSADQTITGDNENYFNQLIIQHDASATSSVIQNNNVTTNDLTVDDNNGTFEFKVKDPANSGLRLTVQKNLTLNGNLRLYDDSQLLRGSDAAASGSGKLYRDQMGTGDKYWYNYWCAPVNNGGTWTVSSLMDGRDPDNPQAIVFENSYTVNGSPNVNSSQNPAHLNEAFIFKFENGDVNNYNAWVYIGSSTAINPGVGYTMKGPNIKNAARPGSSTQTEFKAYTFAGKPNNGTYTFTIGENKNYLIGNPYPSALDANAFINDNTGTTGTLYFWEHVGGTSHALNDYVGGYATYTLAGGVPAKDWQTHSNTVGTKTPGQYIPVGQGFFVERTESGDATITIQNSQRAYYKEDGSNSVFMRSGNTDIRILFTDPAGGQRELLLAQRPGTSLGYDWGYDGRNHDDVYHGDMFFDINGDDYVIQATDSLGGDVRVPLHVVLLEDGQVSFSLRSVQNTPAGMEYYIIDTQNHASYRIDVDQPQSVNLTTGDYHNRFYFAFRPADDLKVTDHPIQDIGISYADGIIRISNPAGEYLENLSVFSVGGKEIFHSRIQSNKKLIRIPASLSVGVYIYRLNGRGKKESAGKFLVK